jgi:two-component system, NtrC family, nitrogen regulation sensor histidine kinase NtrY
MSLRSRLVSIVKAVGSPRSARSRLSHALGGNHHPPPDQTAQRERDELLRLAVDTTPMAILMLGETGTIKLTNAAARDMFFEGREVNGQNFLTMLIQVTPALRAALLSEMDHIFSFDEGAGLETYHISRRQLVLAGEPHTLVTVRNMSAEISRQENAVLKRTIRIIGHELSNTLAPVSSLLQTGRQILPHPEMHAKLERVFSTVEERLSHLAGFLGGLAELGQLPRPRLQEVPWTSFLSGLRALFPDLTLGAPPPGNGWFDAAQIQQVVINLVKNAREAGGPTDGVSVTVETALEGGFRLSVLDRGPGMSDEVAQNALLPSFTTKEKGSGMGLTLCREIAEAHNGRLRIARRSGGGTAVSIWLPPRGPTTALATLSRTRLTLTRS